MLKAYICNVKTTSPTMFALLKVVYLCLTCLYVFKWRVVFFISRYVCSTVYTYTYNAIFGQHMD